MRTTTKAFKEEVRGHIADILDVWDIYDEDDAREPLKDVAKGFHHFYGLHEQRVNRNKQEGFIEWLKGLPSEINIEFTSYGIQQVLQQWFGDNYVEHNEDKEAHVYFHLVYRELTKLFEMYGIHL